MLDVERFQRGSGGGRSGRSRRRGKQAHPAFGEWKDGVPELGTRGGAAGDRLISMDTAHREEGNGQNGRWADALTLASDCSSKNPVQLNKLAFELTRGSSRKAGGTSIKMLIDQEMSKDMQSRKHSPSVVAKLMGLDSLPAQQPDYMQKESASCLHKESYQGFPGKHFYDYEDPQEDFKDVFEVVETKIAEEPGNWPVQKLLSKSRRRHKKMDYIRQKFMDAKRLSTDEKLQNSMQFSEALEVLESNKDLFLNLLQEPSSLFVKHLEEYQSASTTPEASHIMILKSYNVTEYENNDIHRRLERKTERKTYIKRNVVDKHESDFVSHCIKEHNTSLSKKLLKNKLEGKTESGSLPTHIVVLKPSLESVQGTICRENSQLGNSGYRRHRELRRSGTWEMFSELREQQTFPDDAVVPQRTKGSREIAKEISKHLTHTVTDDSAKSCGLGHSACRRHKNSRRMPEASKFMEFGTLRWSSDWLEKSRSSSHSTETSVSREARKRLSERWKMTHKFQEVQIADQGTSTLGEMLALSDREMPDVPLSSSPCQKWFQNKMPGKDVLARWGSPSGISSRDAWKDQCSSSLLRSKSLPASSFIYGVRHGTSDNDDNSVLENVMDLGPRNSYEGSICNERLSSPYRNVKICLNSSQHPDDVVDENECYTWETNVDQDVLQGGLNAKKLSEDKTTLSEAKDCSNSNASYPVDSVPVVCDEGAELPCLVDERPLPQSVVSIAPIDVEYSIVCDQQENVTKETSSNEPHTESLPCVTGQACSPTVKIAEHPSPVSVLEPQDENESSPECFERVNADLQELRMQLQLLKSESRDANAEGLFILSGEDAAGGCDGILQAGGNQLTFQDEDNMEFYYLVDVLIDSGLHNVDCDVLFSACFSLESPMDPDVFEKLEEMYNQFTWTRTERKLLFDLINSTLAEIIAPRMDPHPWIKPRRIQSIGYLKHLADEVWQSMVRVRKDSANDPVATGLASVRWLDLGDDIDAVGRKIERMLKNDLLEELVSEIMSPDRSVYTCRHCGKNNTLTA